MSTSLVPSSEQRRTVFRGTQTSSLTIKSDYNSAQNVYCKVSFTGATNTPVSTNTVTFAVVPGTGNETVIVEYIDDFGATCNASTSNLRGGAVTLNTTATNTNGDQYRDDIMSFYAPDKDVPVYIDLYGGAGQDFGFCYGRFSKPG